MFLLFTLFQGLLCIGVHHWIVVGPTVQGNNIFKRLTSTLKILPWPLDSLQDFQHGLKLTLHWSTSVLYSWLYPPVCFFKNLYTASITAVVPLHSVLRQHWIWFNSWASLYQHSCCQKIILKKNADFHFSRTFRVHSQRLPLHFPWILLGSRTTLNVTGWFGFFSDRRK